jgi:hypothetical protein
MHKELRNFHSLEGRNIVKAKKLVAREGERIS